MSDQAQTQLPKYKCHKEVHAAKIVSIDPGQDGYQVSLDIGGYVIVSDAWLNKHAPQLGGYLVVHEDGSQSYSPADAFEGGYTLLPSDAEAASANAAIQRAESVAKAAAPLRDTVLTPYRPPSATAPGALGIEPPVETKAEASPQQNANRAWAELGQRMGFDSDTAQPAQGKGPRFFTAEPTPDFVAAAPATCGPRGVDADGRQVGL